MVDEKPFCELVKYQCPGTKANDIPHRQKIQNEIIEKAKVAIQRLTDHFSVCFK